MASGPDLIGPVFGLLCRLTADRRQAEWLTARVLASSVSPSQALDEARRLYLLDSVTNASGPRGDDPVSAMTPESRVADERNPDSPNAPLWRSRDLWLDDDTRHRIRDLATTVPASARGEGGSEIGGGLPAAPLMSPRRKRTLIVSAGLTVAVLAAMVASSAIGSDSDALGEDGFTPTSATTESSESPDTTDDTDDAETTEATDDTSGTVPFTVVVETTLPQFTGSPGYFVRGDPDGMEFLYAWEGQTSTSNGWLQLWTSPDADRAAGKWALIATDDLAASGLGCCELRTDASRIEIGGAPALVSTAADGVIDVMTNTLDDERIQIRSYGFSFEELVRLVVGVGASVDKPVLDDDAMAVLGGLTLATERSGGWGFVESALWNNDDNREVNYVQSDEPNLRVWVSASRSTEQSLLLSRLLKPDPGIAAAPRGRVTIGGHDVLVTMDEGDDSQPPTLRMQYIDGEDIVTVAGQVGFDALVRIVDAVEQASEKTWARTLTRESEPFPGASDPSPPPRFINVASTEVDTARYDIAVSDNPRVVRISRYADSMSGPLGEYPLDVRREVNVLTTLEATLIVATIDRPGTGVSSVLFTPEGASSTLVPLIELDEASTVAAAFAYSTYGSCLVQLVGTDGEILGELASTPPEASP